MPDARIVRSIRFRARHRYGRAAWSRERNLRTFGPQVEPHEHDWRVELVVRGPVDPETGFSVDVGSLDAALGGLVAGWDGGDLNELLPEVRAGEIVPTTEELARWLYERLVPEIAPPARVELVRVFESDDLGSEYPAP